MFFAFFHQNGIISIFVMSEAVSSSEAKRHRFLSFLAKTLPPTTMGFGWTGTDVQRADELDYLAVTEIKMVHCLLFHLLFKKKRGKRMGVIKTGKKT
jgi:hypothetical protein